MNKKITIIILATLIIVLGVAVLVLYSGQRKKQAETEKIQTQMTDAFKKTAFDTAYEVKSAESTNLKGTMDAKANFQGDILNQDAVVQNIVKVGDKVYTKAPKEDKWLLQQNPTFLAQINLMSHPEYIQLKKYLKKDSDGNPIYAILYDQTSKILSGKLTREQKAQRVKLQLTGTVTLDQKTGQLKELKLSKDAKTPNEVTINYTINTKPPLISEPNK